MKIATKYLGEVEIKQEEVISFEKGVPGFEEEKKFVVLPFAEDTPFFILQSTNTSNLAFLVTNPFVYFKDYEFDLTENQLKELATENSKDVVVFVILTVGETFEKTTANLQAPVVINKNNKQGKQIVLNNTNYYTKHLLISNPSNTKKEGK
jgi:flagellar assembly factor FliW